MRFISLQRTMASKWLVPITISCVFSGCASFFTVGNFTQPTKYSGTWRFVITSPECINFESEVRIPGSHFTVKTRDLPPLFREKFGVIGGFIRDGRVSTASGVGVVPEIRAPIVQPIDPTLLSNFPIAQVKMTFPNRSNGSGTFHTPDCSGTITAQRIR